ncbi:MAG TPA: hypothetical protein PKZ69_05025 [Candidatus Cloacimonadota bacterium]|nr:hypothetical protein [Candidatus Cloacimonadota bacterium]
MKSNLKGIERESKGHNIEKRLTKIDQEKKVVAQNKMRLLG